MSHQIRTLLLVSQNMGMTKQITFLFLLLTSCVTKEANDIHTQDSKVPNQIVLVFQNFPKDYSINMKDTQGKAYMPVKPEIRYYDDHLIQRIFKPLPETSDTVRIACNRESIEFQHSVKGVDNFEYIFQKGDTVIFSYYENIPTAKVINRTISDFETNYDLKQREIICDNDYQALTKIVFPFMFITYNSTYIAKEGERPGILGQIDRVKNDALLKLTKEFELERNLLDSLFSESIISNESYKWLNQKLKIKEATAKVYIDALGQTDFKSLISKDLDTLLNYHSYRNLLTNISSTFYARKIKRKVTTNSNLTDYKILYDSIFGSNYFSARAKKMLLFETSDYLMQNNGATEISEHLKRIKNEITDTVLVSYLIDKFELKNQITEELQLIRLNGTQTTLSNLVQENAGKIVYVDMWASWCGPCIEEFPQSKILIEKFKGENVAFIYLSIDDDRNKWQASSKKHNLPEHYSFLVQNKKTSKYLEKLELNSIPRYLIFNKSGELEFTNAPRPSEEQTIKIIERLIVNSPAVRSSKN
jgi:thiol-disulfide isomerase/thioredoxin